MTSADLSNMISKVAAFRPGPYEVHVHPDDVAAVRQHGDVLERWDATIVPNEQLDPGEIFVSGRAR